MAILATDIKFRKAARMTDFDDGGGRMSSNEIVDGMTNNVFDDLSDIDGILGNVSLRKAYLQVDTANTDPYLKPFVFLTELPQNENVHVLLLGYESPESQRTDARNYYESYRIIGVKSPYVLYGDHFEGQEMLQVYCRSEVATPDIGDVFCLSVEANGYAPAQQFVQVREVLSRNTYTFTDSNGDFDRDVIILSTTTALTQGFPGQQDPERFARPTSPSPTLVRRSQVSDSARYYGMKECTTAPVTGDLTVNVGDPYVPAVPTTQAETALVDRIAALGTLALIESGADNALTFSTSLNGAAGVAVTRYLGTPYAPGSLAITVGSVALKDDGSGNVVAASPADTGWGGSADYATGAFSILRDVGFSGTVSVTATPAGAMSQQSFSRAHGITAANRNISYVFQLPGQPCPGTVIISYMALGKWYTLTDNGHGQATGNAGEGTATINYATGSVGLTCGALPDVDTAIIQSWGVNLRARDASGEITIPTPSLRMEMTHGGIVPGTWSMAWVSGSVSKSATAGDDGEITGDATGWLDHTAGVAEFTTTVPADSATQYHPTYDYVDPTKRHSEVFTPTAAGGQISVTLAHAPKERSVVARWSITADNPNGGQAYSRSYAAKDDGAGGWTGPPSGTNTINYSTGAIVLKVQ